MPRLLVTLLLAFTLFAALSCSSMPSSQAVTNEEEARIKAELRDRSFRQFEPSKDASPRKGVILDFSGRVRIWAQYAEDRRVVNEWEIEKIPLLPGGALF